MPDPLTPRAAEIVRVARALLERDGPEGVTMRTLAAELGIRAPSLYKHFADKAAVEVAIVVGGFHEAAAAFEAATEAADDPLAAFVEAYREFVREHPHVYRLMTERPLPRDRMPPGLTQRTAAPLLAATGSPERARAAWAFIHGMVTLELNDRSPHDDLTEPAWASGIDAFRRRP